MSVPNTALKEPSEKISPPSELGDAEGNPIRPKDGIDLEPQEGNQNRVIVYSKGWKLHTLTLA